MSKYQWYNILSELEDIRKEIEFLKQEIIKIPMIEIDIALEKIYQIYDNLLQIKLKAALDEETGFLSKNSNLLKKIITESEVSFDSNNEKKETKSSEFNYLEEVKQKKTIKVLGEELGKNKKTIGDYLSTSVTKEKTVAENLKIIKDLKDAISLNDKIMFIKEIFNGKVDEYNKCIETINTSRSLEEALNYLYENIDIHKKESEPVKRLIELISLKFKNI